MGRFAQEVPFRKVIRTKRNLEFFTNGYQFLVQVLPGVVVAPLYFSGKIELGVVSQSLSSLSICHKTAAELGLMYHSLLLDCVVQLF